MNLVFALFSDAQGTSGLRIKLASKGTRTRAARRRIHRHSRQHLAEAYALGGPMKDRLGSALQMAYSGGDRSHAKGHMIEPMQPDLAGAVRPPSATEQLAARAAGRPMQLYTSVAQLIII